jgi:hypothetical protein
VIPEESESNMTSMTNCTVAIPDTFLLIYLLVVYSDIHRLGKLSLDTIPIDLSSMTYTYGFHLLVEKHLHSMWHRGSLFAKMSQGRRKERNHKLTFNPTGKSGSRDSYDGFSPKFAALRKICSASSIILSHKTIMYIQY